MAFWVQECRCNTRLKNALPVTSWTDLSDNAIFLSLFASLAQLKTSCDPLLQCLLWVPVLWGTVGWVLLTSPIRTNRTHHRGERHLEAVDAGQTKVGQFDLSPAGDQDILGLQVTVNHSVRVQEVQTLEQLVHHILQKSHQKTEEGYFYQRDR